METGLKPIYYFKILFIGAVFGVCFILIMAPQSMAQVSVTATVNGVCGNGILEFNEQCEGANLNGQTCSTLGFLSGTLVCSVSCTFDTSGCVIRGGGGGGGGGGYIPATQVIFSGKAYPKSSVTLLKDAQIVATTIAGSDASFQISVGNLSGGNYIFGIYSEDKNGLRSSLLTFPVSVTTGATTNVSGIFIAPSIAADKTEVKKGDDIAIFGQSAPSSEITIVVGSDDEHFAKTTSDKDGTYLYNFDTSDFSYGDHTAKTKSALTSQMVSSFSKVVNFKVGTKTVFAKIPQACAKIADLNNDCKVDLVDFSIAAYWYKRTLTQDAKNNIDAKLSPNGRIDLVDFSIMAYYWTG